MKPLNFNAIKSLILTICISIPGAGFADCRNMFDEQGVVEATVPEKHNGLDEAALEEACTEDAIECGAEEVEVVDFQSKIVSVSKALVNFFF